MVAIFTGQGTGYGRGSGAVLGAAGLIGKAGLGASGDQVLLNAANGNLIVQREDQMLVGRGPDISLFRTYNSQGDGSDDNGDNWALSFMPMLYGLSGNVNTTGSFLFGRDWDGTVTQYDWSGSAYVADKGGTGARDSITYDGTWRLTGGTTGTVETYGQWQPTGVSLSSVTDTDGNTVNYYYDGSNLKATWINAADWESVDLTWNGNNLTSVMSVGPNPGSYSWDARTTTYYQYDGLNRLTSVTVDNTPADNSTADGNAYTTSYSYVGNSRLIATIDETYGTHLAIGYQDNKVHTLAQTIADGVTQTTTIDYYTGYTNVTDPAGQVTRLDYNSDKSLAKVTLPAPSLGSAQPVTQFGYDAVGNVTSVTDALNHTSHFAYDSIGNLLTTTDPLGAVTTRTYGARNQLLTETVTGSDATGAAVAHTTRYVYDGSLNLHYLITAAGEVTQYERDGVGQAVYDRTFPGYVFPVQNYAANQALTEADLAAWTAGLPDLTQTAIGGASFDGRGDLQSSVSYGRTASDGSADASDGYGVTYYSYDQQGRIASVNRNGQNSVSYAYDGMGRVVSSTDLNGGTTSVAFNDAGRQVVVTTAGGLVTTSVYNRAGQLISATQGGNLVTAGTAATYAYDADGRLRVATDPAGVVTYYLYDALGRKVGQADAQGDFTEYRYDLDGRLVETIAYATQLSPTQLSALANAAIDPDISTIRPADNAADIWSTRILDADGRVIETIDGTGAVTTIDYDGEGRVVRQTAYGTRLDAATLGYVKDHPPSAVVLPAVDPATDRTSRIFYDADDHIVGTVDGEGFVVQSTYDGVGNKVSETQFASAVSDASVRATGSFNAILAATSASAGDRTTHWVYDKQGLLAYTIDAGGFVTGYGYHAQTSNADLGQVMGDVRAMTVYAGAIAGLASYTVDTVRAALSAAGLTGNANNRVTYAIYDAAGRIAYSVDATGDVTGNVYDNQGNLIRQTRYATPLQLSDVVSVDVMNWWAGTYGAPSDRVTRYFYDAAGELKFTVDAEHYVTRRDYDADGHLVAEVRFAGTISVNDWTTAGDVNGWTAANASNAVTTSYVYDAEGRLQDSYDGTGVRRTTLYNATGTIAATIVDQGGADQQRTNYLYDAAGRVITTVESPGTGTQRQSQTVYNAFGEVVDQINPNGDHVSYAYDHRGQATSITRGALPGQGARIAETYVRDAFGDTVTLIDARGYATYSYYDREGRVIAIRDADGYVTETSYDAFGDMATVTRRARPAANAASAAVLPQVTPDGQDATTAFAYDKLGRPTTTTDAMGHSEQKLYDAFGQVVQEQNKLGGITLYRYDHRGLLTDTFIVADDIDASGYSHDQVLAGYSGYYAHHYDYDARGNVIADHQAWLSSETRTIRYAYDADDRVISKQLDAVTIGGPGGSGTGTPTETYAYDHRGNLIETTDANGAHRFSYYDDHDQKIAEIDALGVMKTYAYDGAGNVTMMRTYATALPLPSSPGGNPPIAPIGDYRQTLYAYDALDRLTTSSVTGVRVGSWNGSVYTIGWTSISATSTYDAAGNVVRAVDGAGNATYSYYDNAGRKVAQVDAEGYETTWTLDAEGNVLSEHRYANAVSGAAIGFLPVPVASSADRITNFTYDRVGNRLTETRLAVLASSIDGATGGNFQTFTGSSVVQYSYNALGEVTSKTEATGDTTTYTYDGAGRLTSEHRPYMHPGFDVAMISPELDYSYDALGDLTRTIENGRVETRNVYGADGRLATSYDANGFATTYWYDAAGNKVAETYVRTDADRVQHAEGQSFAYDARGQLIQQYAMTSDGGWWHAVGAVNGIGYDAFGEVTQRTLNGAVQDEFAYDAAGRVWRDRTGDGVTRFFAYDGAGNQTLQVDDVGANLYQQSFDTVLGYLTNWGSQHIGDSLVGGINATITQYSARNLAIATIQPQRETSSGTITLATHSQYNAFGELSAQTDVLGNNTYYDHNTMGRVTRITHPAVWVADEHGGGATATPIETYDYDISGRLIATVDADGNLNRRSLIAGTGYGGKDPLVWREFHADGGIITNSYDVYGNLIGTTDAVGRHTTMGHDYDGRLTEVVHANGLVDTYTNDELGERIAHSDNVHATAERAYYDAAGRVTVRVAFGGDTTTIGYDWQSWYGVASVSSGAWQTVTTLGNGLQSVEHDDAFGHVLAKTDFGGHETLYHYDTGGRMTAAEPWGNPGGSSVYYQYYNTGRVSYASVGTGSYYYGNYAQISGTWYGYDARGLQTSESELSWGDWHWVKLANASYDALGRMTSWSDTGSNGPPASVTWSYDAAGNIREQHASYQLLDQNGSPSGPQQSDDEWFTYDAMNRVAIAGGRLSSGQVVRGSGLAYLYDADGELVQSLRSATIVTLGVQWAPDTSQGYDGGDFVDARISYPGEEEEDYTYDLGGAVSSVQVLETGWGTNFATQSVTVSDQRDLNGGHSVFSHDQLGRLVDQTDYVPSQTSTVVPDVGYSDHRNYDEEGRVTTETSTTLKRSTGGVGSSVWQQTSYTYASATDQGASSAVTQSSVNGGSISTSTTATSYAWYDGQAAASVTVSGPTGSATTSFAYDGAGRLVSASVGGVNPRDVRYTLDAQGQVIRRDESASGTGDGSSRPHQLWYRFGGREIGTVTNDGLNATDGANYPNSDAVRQTELGTGTFIDGQNLGYSTAQFGAAPDAINSYSQGSAAGSYTVRAGDTLSSIAGALWGDASLWYKLAQANGLAGDGGLTAGATLSIPAGVMRSANSAGTYRPYNAASVVGDLSPTTPQPQAAAQQHNGCGVFGAILLAVVAVAVAVLLPEVAGTYFGAGGALGGGVVDGVVTGAVAGAVSQGVGLATGIQDKFSWSGLALSAIGGGIGAALDGANPLGIANNTAQAAVNAVLGNIALQGVGVVTGLQSKFDFAGVAAAGLGAGLASQVHLGGIGGAILRGGASDLANAAARSLINGTDFGDNVLAALPDAIGQTVGDAMAARFARRGMPDLAYGAKDMSPGEKALVSEAQHSADASSNTSQVSSYKAVGKEARFQGLEPLGDRGNAISWLSDEDEITIMANERYHPPIDESTAYDFSVFSRRPFDLSTVAPSPTTPSISLAQLDQMEASPFAAIGYGIARAFGASQARTAAAINLGEASNAVLLGIGGMRGAEQPYLGSQNAFRITPDAAAQAEVLATSKFAPNPYGRLGGPEHQALVADITADINLRGLIPKSEFRIPTPDGTKSARYVDVVAIDPISKLPVEYYQVGKQTLAGNPIAREAQAIRDIQQVTNWPITFKPYNKVGK